MINLTVGKQLKKIRQKLDMTLDDVSAITDVSKPMLGQIERGQSSPTINTLWKIATGLKVPLSYFLKESKTEYSVINIEEQDIISAEEGKMRAYTLFPFDPVRNFETFYIEFDSGCKHISNKHNDNVEETILVLRGKLDIILNEQIITLSEKQAIRFAANIEHTYQNYYDTPCCVCNTILY